jgi:hypothetical protein
MIQEGPGPAYVLGANYVVTPANVSDAAVLPDEVWIHQSALARPEQERHPAVWDPGAGEPVYGEKETARGSLSVNEWERA